MNNTSKYSIYTFVSFVLMVLMVFTIPILTWLFMASTIILSGLTIMALFNEYDLKRLQKRG